MSSKRYSKKVRTPSGDQSSTGSKSIEQQARALLGRPKNYDRFHQHMQDLIVFLRKTVADQHKPVLKKAIHKYLTFDKDQYLEYTLTNLTPYIDDILKADEMIFLTSQNKGRNGEHGKSRMDFLIGFDFRLLWQQNLSTEQKRVIFRFLLYLYMQASAALGKNRTKVKEILAVMKMEREIEREAQDNPNAFDDDGEEGSSITDIFGEDSVLLELAQEISQEMDFGSLLNEVVQSSDFQAGGNPMETVAGMFQHPKMVDKLKELGKSLNQKVQEKDLGEQDILGALQKAQGNLAKKMSNNPGAAPIAQFIKNLDLGQMMDQFKVQAEQATDGAVDEQGNPQMPPDLANLMGAMSQNPVFQNMMGQMPATTGVPTNGTDNPVKAEAATPDLLSQMMDPAFQAKMHEQMEQMRQDPQFQSLMCQMQQGFEVEEFEGKTTDQSGNQDQPEDPEVD